ncbi:MAG: hypothetical protein AB7S50_01130 [Bacteroidales bacterium]
MKQPKDNINWKEVWKDLVLENAQEHCRYKISNYGQILVFTTDNDKGQLVKLIKINGFTALNYKDNTGKFQRKYIHKLVAENFLNSPKQDQDIVLHIDFNSENNYYQNLIWATHQERFYHWKKYKPDWFGNKKQNKPSYSKLTEAKVKLLKKKLLDPKRRTRIKILARQFGVSEMQLNRIKRGENWGHIKV